MKIILFLALTIFVAFQLPQRARKTPEQKQWSALKNGYSWARVILNFAELKNLSGGALEELSKAIEDLMVDLDHKSTRATKEYHERTALNESEVKRLNSETDSAQLDISDTTETLDNILYVQKQQLIEQIAQLEKDIENNGKYVEEQKTLRIANHSKFLERIKEHQDGIAAIEECLALLAQLQGSGDEISLAQRENVKTQFSRVKAKLGKNAESKLIEALVDLSSTEFADKGALTKVVELLNEIKNNLIAGVASDNDEEEKAVVAFEADMKFKLNETNKMQLEKTDASAQLEKNAEQIQNAEDFVKERTADLAEWQEDLVDENKSFVTATTNFDDLIAQLNKELEACKEANELIENAGFAGYIEGRTDQNKVIDQAKGDNIQVTL